MPAPSAHLSAAAVGVAFTSVSHRERAEPSVPTEMNIVFDWAGTLADDQELTWRITDQTIQSFGKNPVDFETYKREFSLPAQAFYKKFCSGISWEEIETA